ncbi:MAG: hypothetical protein GC185_04820 [Alphaproteobacteria bacterium]|nr:hypothetical protein [Alphaproteobacteria bacterium]
MLKKIFSKVSGRPEQQLWNDALRAAAIKGDLKKAQKAIAKGAEIDWKDVNGLTPLYFAATNGHLAVAKLLLEKGAAVDTGKPCENTGTGLTQAAYNGDAEMLKLLIEHKADINAGSYTRCAIHDAVWRNNAEAVEVLAEAGAKLETRDRMGHTPLMDAVAFNYREVALILVRHGADASVTDKYGDDMRKAMVRKVWLDVVEAIDTYKAEAAAREAARLKAEEQAAAAREKALDEAATLQRDVKVSRPLVVKRRQP